jgi:2-desacetyl-2-hydroxyethyl bacteriochlorophyllide A dehydrogenase
MKALVYHGVHDIRLEDVDRPQLRNGDDVCIRVKAVSICGSDLSGYKGTSKFRVAPLIMGHEFAGDIAAVGPAVAGIQVGQRVTVNPSVPCGTCHNCQAGRRNLCQHRKNVGTTMPAGKCDGAMAEYVCVPAATVIPLPDTLSYEEAALLEPLGVSLRAVKRAGPLAGEAVAVVGAGPIGLLAMQCAKQLGAATVVGLDVLDERLETARQCGADLVVNSKRDPVPAVLAVTAHRGVAVAIDAVGVSDSVGQCLQIVRDAGTIVVIGLAARQLSLDTFDFVCREITLRGSYTFRGEIEEGMELAAAGRINLRGMITSVLPLADGPAVFARLAAGQTSDVKVILQPT